MLGDKIRQYRKLKKISINNLSKITGISLGYLSDLENNNAKNPTYDKLMTIATALGVEITDFLTGEEMTDKQGSELDWYMSEAYEKYSIFNPEPKKEIIPTSTLDIVPEQFINPADARAYISKHRIFSSEGFDVNKLSDEDVLEFGNALLEQMKMVSYKYKK